MAGPDGCLERFGCLTLVVVFGSISAHSFHSPFLSLSLSLSLPFPPSQLVVSSFLIVLAGYHIFTHMSALFVFFIISVRHAEVIIALGGVFISFFLLTLDRQRRLFGFYVARLIFTLSTPSPFL